MCSHKSCSYRLTAVFAIKHVLKLGEDTCVPDVRFNAAKATGAVSALVSGEVRSEKLQPVLAKLVEDEDPDVRYYSSEAMEELLSAS